jgi:hypothetical protein
MAIKPNSNGLTPEAQEHLRTQGIPEGDIDSDTELTTPYVINNYSDPLSEYTAVNPEQFESPAADDAPEQNVGDIVNDAAKAELPAVAKERPITEGFGPRRRRNPGDPKKTAPDVDEWMDFFSRVVIRFLTEWYADYVFRDISEEAISDDDAARLLLTEEERDTIARPYAEFANKNPFLKKHGRQIIAISDSFESTVILGRFMMRVNRIARKYRPEPRKPQRPTVKLRPEENHHGNNGQSQESAGAGPIPEGYPVYNPGGS